MLTESSRRSILRAAAIAFTTTLVLFAVGVTTIRVAQAAARTLTVNTTADGHQGPDHICGSPVAAGACTLRAAIELADGDSGDTVVVPAGVYVLDTRLGRLVVVSSMTISGAGSASTIVDGGHATGVFGVAAAPVSISKLTIRDATVTNLTNDVSGAGIANDGTLTLTDVVVTGGSAVNGFGGGIASDGPLTLTDVVVSDNHGGDGGGLALLGDAKTTITRSTISGNTAEGTLMGILPDFKRRFPGHGGGILVATDGDTVLSLSIAGSTISGNVATGPVFSEGDAPEGGGIFNFGSVMSLANDTLAGNTAVKDVGANHPTIGGGIVQTDLNAPTPVSGARVSHPRQRLSELVPRIMAAEQALTAPKVSVPSTAATALDFVTLAGNRADLIGGIAALAGKFSLANTIVAGSAGANCGGAAGVTSAGFNIETASDCGLAQTGDQRNTDPHLDALGLTAPGITATMALLTGSPAIDAANPHCDQAADQRGLTRPQGTRCDIGAFEVAQATSTTVTTSPPSPPVTGVRAAASIEGSSGTAGALAVLLALVTIGAALALRSRMRRA